MSGRSSLQGLRLLVVEDEAIVAMMVEDMLIDLGCVVAGVAGTVAEGLALMASNTTGIDGALLDVNVGGVKVFPIADLLAERDVPFMFATGYGAHGLSDRFAGRPVVAKPFSVQSLEEALITTFGIRP